MSETLRAQLISDLLRDLLGPRGDADEIIPEELDPRQEFQVGQLYPCSTSSERDPDADAELLGDSNVDDDDADDGPPAILNVGQSFRRNPTSLGITFSLENDCNLKICVTWARYVKKENVGWVREPKIFIVDSVQQENNITHDSSNEIQIFVRRSLTADNKIRVSVYASSLIALDPDSRLSADKLIFQPEIRIIVDKPESIVEMSEGGFSSSDNEWRLSMRQYDNRKVLARGHLCGVYWADIDPQLNRPVDFNHPPFVWQDGIFHAQRGIEQVKQFFEPTLRTDFLPMYSTPSPEYDLEGVSLNAEDLANASQAGELQNLVSPFLEAYETWIGKQKEIFSGELDDEILIRHEAALRRMREGLLFLIKNSTARLAFNFMNQAMNIQTQWSRGGQHLVWRPFQLGFILLTMKSSVEKDDPDRATADILWFPTGGGKSEAYLGLAAFVAAYRRASSVKDEHGDSSGEGTSILSRYTLRLLTIQQFRRALKVVSAMEYLRCYGSDAVDAGWVPSDVEREGWIWGRASFSIGLWVGSNVTPNKLAGEPFRGFPGGALYALKKPPIKGESDPAQILNCPSCSSILAIPVNGLSKGEHILHLFSYDRLNVSNDPSYLQQLSSSKVTVIDFEQNIHQSGRIHVLSIQINLNDSVEPNDIMRWWREKIENVFRISLVSFNMPIRPGYVPVASRRKRSASPVDYEVRCPNPSCDLHNSKFQEKEPQVDGYWWKVVHPLFASQDDEEISIGIPIQGLTVDEKIYYNPPTFVVGTVDKLAITPSYNEADAASIFGRVRSYNSKNGYSQEYANGRRGQVSVDSFAPPDLIVQDELHLLDGPLGSAFGLYETVLDVLAGKPKYVASSATIRNSIEQVTSIMSRRAQIFPPVNNDIDSGFFLRIGERHPLDESGSGRLFIGVAAPGKAAQTPIVRIWSRLLQSTHEFVNQGGAMKEADFFWTLAGYFNAIRELAGGEALWRQDIPDRLKEIARLAGTTARDTTEISCFRNLSSQTDSSELPGVLAAMERKLTDGDPLSGVAATSMFGTGVDVDRLSLMVVHGQPKSASSYIQAVGRIGRKRSGLAVVFLRVGKPRDLNHYEYFTGYHRRLSVAVEPISVKPLAPRAVERILGPLIVMLYRNARDELLSLPRNIWEKEGANSILSLSEQAIEFVEQLIQDKWSAQPTHRRPENEEELIDLVRSSVDQWKELARRTEADPDPLKYIDRVNKEKAVLGEPNVHNGDYAFRNAPTSLREVEATIKVYTRSGGNGTRD